MTGAELALYLLGVSGFSGMIGWLAGGRRLPQRAPFRPSSRRDEATMQGVGLEELLAVLPDCAVLLTRTGSLRFASMEAQAVFGDALGTIVRHPDVFAALQRLDAETVLATADIILDVPVRRVVHLVFRLVPETLSLAGVPVLAILSDTSEKDAVERVRADFVAYASHELRTPLAALIGFIETLRGPAADDPVAQKQFLEIMATQAGRMQRLIEQLLALSRVEMMEHRKPRGEMDAARIVSRVRDESAPLCAARGVELKTEARSLVFQGDEDQIVQVLLNLVENATKYAVTGQRAPVVSLVMAQSTVGGKAGVSLTVADNGPGIEARHLPRLTERFYRVEGGQGQSAPGYGLGLAIVRHIVDRHDGRLFIESEIGAGTRCTVWLPLRGERRQAKERPSLLLG
ncbi:ATP-binding protein [Acetobacter oeni]|uniref:histidine kinase n=1 Tax=Acetobacter oeni TaxID=304077 RepID=A0A511XH97_9PROT|nr:ATP-binding protein [Acetobacter oeni]MBB3882435.1 two-component system phosphate regulon sensor histidine kinase PhoR [Acetobacter oeni]NHO18471.1 histidine kinase [Acetobacter oeni]GBR00440.1 two component sensor histidine kinase PhoR [Acetobacter oeni LMG 21952]GEN62291.1 two-component sensor histidine kinase [Acetobacter oeni]